jgi:hypothetical protein
MSNQVASNLVAMSGNDSLVLQNNIFTAFADQSPFELTFPTEIATVKIGKNGNAMFAQNNTGASAEATLRLLRATPDDQLLNGLMAQQLSNFPGFVLLGGTFVKQIGSGTGVITSDTYILAGGIFTMQISAKMNVEGDAEQTISIYKIKFASAARVIT